MSQLAVAEIGIGKAALCRPEEQGHARLSLVISQMLWIPGASLRDELKRVLQAAIVAPPCYPLLSAASQALARRWCSLAEASKSGEPTAEPPREKETSNCA